MTDWKKVERVVYRQYLLGFPEPTEERMSVEAFKEKYPQYVTGITTLCYPEVYDWTAKIDDNVNLWIRVKSTEIEGV